MLKMNVNSFIFKFSTQTEMAAFFLAREPACA